jgi:type I restriction enzyme M protein
MTPRKNKIEVPKSTAQQLGSIVKSSRDIMRKDKGLNGDLDRLPMLTWIMFLKFLDDMEQVREEEAKLAGKKFRQAIDPPYRWRDWANKPEGMTGPELIAFINQEEAVRPDGKKGAGLFAYLRSLQSTNGDRRDVIAKVFDGTVNRMINGYLLRDVINKVNQIHFTSRDEIHTLGQLYESMLREMRDAAGDSGEFYTPRPLVKFIVAAVDPKLGEAVLDPAAGTGGFLVEAFEHLKKQSKKTEDFVRLQKGTLHGIEPKPLPYLLCQMNLLLHGVEYPEIDPENALRFPLREIGDRDRVDVIMTNPPFGGEEERGILSNFPEDKQTAETALLFLQLIMRKLRRPVGGSSGGRCGMVVPNGVLFGDGICARIKEELLKEFNLHTIVRLPNGIFAPYTGIATNLLFLDRSGPTKTVWFYEQPLPGGRKTYTKTQPLRFEEFDECLKWWKKREENDHAWKVSVAELIATGCNLDRKNPHAKEDITHLPPEQLAESVRQKEERIAEIMTDIKRLLTKQDA